MGQGQQQQQQSDGGLGPLWILAALFMAIIIAWMMGHAYIVAFVFKIKILEADLVGFFTNSLQDTVLYMRTTPYDNITLTELGRVCTEVGNYIRYPIGIILILLGVVQYLNDHTQKYQKTYSMDSLHNQEKQIWYQVQAVYGKNLAQEDISKGPWAMGMNPIEFAKANNLLKRDDFSNDAQSIAGQELTAAVKRGEAKRIFTLQLGSYWEGFDVLKGVQLALCGVFLARMNRDRDASNQLLQSLNESVHLGKFNVSFAKKIVDQYKNSELAQEIVANHAYVFTVMGSMLSLARTDGVLPTSDFLWLKPVDRRLWYVLNSVGRQTPYVEVSGVFAHWIAEKALNRKSMVPMVDEAVKALELAVRDVKLSPREMEELQ